MNIETDRLKITEFTSEMAQDVHENSLDDDTRRFLPDEVFETLDDARNTISFLMSQYDKKNGPFVYPVLLKDGTNIGYVQAVLVDDSDWEIGYHVAKRYTGNGYATESVKLFLPFIMERLQINTIYGICDSENVASCKVLEKCGFILNYEGTGEYQGKQKKIRKYLYTERS